MSTRAAIRPRPLDINKQLLLVKDVSELDEQTQGPENGSQHADVSKTVQYSQLLQPPTAISKSISDVLLFPCSTACSSNAVSDKLVPPKIVLAVLMNVIGIITQYMRMRKPSCSCGMAWAATAMCIAAWHCSTSAVTISRVRLQHKQKQRSKQECWHVPSRPLQQSLIEGPTLVQHLSACCSPRSSQVAQQEPTPLRIADTAIASATPLDDKALYSRPQQQ